MYLLNLSLGQFLVLFGSVSAFMVALYLLDRSRRRQVVATLRFWSAAEQPAAVHRKRRIQQPWSLLLQLISIALLLLALAELRWGTRLGAPRDHILILETSAWMAARSGGRTLMDAARDRARAYLRAVPARDRIMLVRADALTTPATAFEPDRRKLERAVMESVPGATAMNLEQALAYARQLQSQTGRRAGEIVIVGAGRVSDRDPRTAAVPSNLRYIAVPENLENAGIRRMGVRRSTTDPAVWEVYASAKNYGSSPRVVQLDLSFGGALIGSRSMTLAPGAEKEATFEYRTRAAGALEAAISPHDAFPQDDHALVEVPAEQAVPVTVYSDEPDLLRPVLASGLRVNATFKPTREYRPDSGPGLVVIDRFRPPAKPANDAIWIDPPAEGSPIPVRARRTDAPFARWHSDHPLGAGLRTKDFKLAAASVFEAAPDDIRIGEVEGGPVVVARGSKPKIVVLGFHPALSAMRYELATPLLFANMLRWMSPETFRRWELNAGSAGTASVELDADVKPENVRVLHEDGSPVPFAVHDRALDFFAGKPGTVRVLAGDREYVYSLTLPQLGESKWQPANVRHGIPRFAPTPGGSIDLWQWLAVLGAAGLIAEWAIYGRFGRRLMKVKPLAAAMRRAS